MKPHLTIILLNWNGWKDTVKCLESIYKIDYPYFNTIVVDNNSKDNSVEKIVEYINNTNVSNLKKTNEFVKKFEYRGKKWNNFHLNKHYKDLFIIKNDKNYGFAEGNNIGIRFAQKNLKYDYILLLNNDTIVKPNFLRELLKPFELKNNIAIAGPQIIPLIKNNIKKDLAIIGSKISFWRGGIPINLKPKSQITDVDMVSGACILIKKEILEELGLLDSTYFFGWEDADFCTRTKRSGYKIVGVEKAQIFHKIGASYGEHFADTPSILSEGVRNQLIFMGRYASPFQKFVSIPFILFQYLFIIFWKSNNISKIKTKTTSIIRGIKFFIDYKNSNLIN